MGNNIIQFLETHGDIDVKDSILVCNDYRNIVNGCNHSMYLPKDKRKNNTYRRESYGIPRDLMEEYIRFMEDPYKCDAGYIMRNYFEEVYIEDGNVVENMDDIEETE